MILAWVPFGLYAAAAAAYLAHFSRPDKRAGRLATALLGGGRARPHLPHRHADDGSGLRAAGRHDRRDLGVRLAPGPRLPVRRAHHRRAGHGRVRHGAAGGAGRAAGAQPADRRTSGAAAQPAVHGPRAVDALRLRELRARLRARHHLRAAVQGDQGEAPRVLLHSACRRCRRST